MRFTLGVAKDLARGFIYKRADLFRTHSYKNVFSIEFYSTLESTNQVGHVTNLSFPDWLILG